MFFCVSRTKRVYLITLQQGIFSIKIDILMEGINNVVYDTDYSGYIADGGYPLFQTPLGTGKLGFFDKLLSGIFPSLFAK